jgi:predicted nucleotidyltransferase
MSDVASGSGSSSVWTARDRRFFAAVVALVQQAIPEVTEVWLHGSRATGKARRSSDWDFVVIVPDDLDDARRLSLSALGSPIDVGRIDGRCVDIQIAKRGHDDYPGSVLYWALREGARLFPT